MDQSLLNLIVNLVDIEQTIINYQNLKKLIAKLLFQCLISIKKLKYILTFHNDEQFL
ncbi:unnamed protein product [Paramecium sonneborni]|uniref:Uncharacterized protein n=1 Tax=Paramecium sonneborni TaxID=65129 RepID=A0A8S1M6Q7_9CILI|nr:unnamed protein product [Paramecium sonneborni]